MHTHVGGHTSPGRRVRQGLDQGETHMTFKVGFYPIGRQQGPPGTLIQELILSVFSFVTP